MHVLPIDFIALKSYNQINEMNLKKGSFVLEEI